MACTFSWERRTCYSIAMRFLCCGLLFVPFGMRTLRADEVTLRNDSLPSSGNVYVQQGFRAGDIGAAVFNPPCHYYPLTIKKVQVYWASQSSDAPQVVTHVRVYGAAGPDPGTPLFSEEGVVMNPGYLNQFATPGSGWTLNQGPFTVGVEYVGQVEGQVTSQSGHLATDSDGCQQGKNLVFDSGSAQWLNPCALGMSGDFVVRVIAETNGNLCYGDKDGDGDVDLLDYAQFQRCVSGDAPYSANCGPLDCSGDGRVNSSDLTSFGACWSGPEIACLVTCAACQCGQFETMPTPPLGLRFTVAQLVVIVSIIILVPLIIGPCVYQSCRGAIAFSFYLAGVQANAPEQNRIIQALDLLQTWGADDTEAHNAWEWYSTIGAYNAIAQIIRVNHWSDNQGIVGYTLNERVAIHQSLITEVPFDVRVLAMDLYAEWQHIDRSSASEYALEFNGSNSLRAFRSRHGLIDVRPDIQHGFSEGRGVP